MLSRLPTDKFGSEAFLFSQWDWKSVVWEFSTSSEEASSSSTISKSSSKSATSGGGGGGGGRGNEIPGGRGGKGIA